MSAAASKSVIATWTFEVDPADFGDLAARGKLAIGQLPPLSGLLGAEILGNEDQTRIVLLSEWESRDAWARAQWDERVGDVLAEFSRRSHDEDFQLYFPVGEEQAG